MKLGRGRVRAFVLITIAHAVGCETDTPGMASVEEAGGKADHVGDDDGPMLPHPGGTGATAPWGGPDPARWTMEARLANAASAALDEAARQPDVVDVDVSIPVVLQTSNFHPFGDGQSNAAPSFMGWPHPRPPVVATRVQLASGSVRIRVRIDREVPLAQDTVTLWSLGPGGWQAAETWPLQRDATGDAIAEGSVASNAARWALAPSGWQDVFALEFAAPVVDVDQLRESVPQDLTELSTGEDVLDPLALMARGSTPTFEYLEQLAKPPAWNAAPYETSQVHGQFPTGGGFLVTAVGRAWTWLVDAPTAPFKNLYVCLERRLPELEAEHGVPSGAGWHRIGDPAETLLHAFESGPLLIGHASGTPWPFAPHGTYAYALQGAATFTVLWPGQAFTTSRDDFHAYAVHASTESCVQLWVHPCPSPALFECE